MHRRHTAPGFRFQVVDLYRLLEAELSSLSTDYVELLSVKSAAEFLSVFALIFKFDNVPLVC